MTLINTLNLDTLLIDAGNTRIKLGLGRTNTQGICSNSWCYLGQCDTHASVVELRAFFATYVNELKHINCAIGVCVAGAEVIQFIIQALPAKLASTMSWLTGQTPLLGLHNHYSTPQTLGADRWLAIYGMLQGIKPTPPTPCILATFGTATTVDVLCWDRLAGAKKTIRNNISEYIENTDGFNAVFTGGIILAGLTSSWRNVSHSTAQLPDVAVLAATTSDTGLWHVPNNTQSALLQGAIWAQIGAVQAFSAQLATLHQEEPHVYLAGGAVQTLAPYLSHAKVLEYPVLMGLAAYQALK